MTPSDRAKAIITSFKASDQAFGPDGKTEMMESLIAQAILDAENDALERAARAVNLRTVAVLSPPLSNATVSDDYLEGLSDALAEIHSLKTPKV